MRTSYSLVKATHISIICFAVLALVFMPSIVFSQSGEDRTVKKLSIASDASAFWLTESQDGNVFEEFILHVIKSKEGTHVFVTQTISDFINNNFEVLSGHTFLDDNSSFDIDNQLDSATLSSVTIDLCGTDQQDENGDCIEAVETVEIEAEWNAIGGVTKAGAKIFIIDVNKLLEMSNAKSTDAVAEATVNGESLGESSSASMHMARSLELIIETSRKVINFGALGNKGDFAAHATWEDVTIDGESARVFLRTSKDLSDGSMLVRLQLGFPESGQFLEGELNIPGSSRNSNDGPLRIDKNLATAELDPVEITVCAIELGSECSDPESEGRAEYTLQASWMAIDDPILTKVYLRTMAEDFRDKDAISIITSPSEATGSLNEIDLGETEDAAIFHASLTL